MLRKVIFILALSIMAFTSACSSQTTPAPAAEIANPASVHCQEKGGTLEFETDSTGGQVGMCVFPDGSVCEEWALFRGECNPGDSLTAPEPAPATEVLDNNGWKIYHNDQLGYSFHYPADAELTVHQEGQDYYVSITGPLVNNEYWPIIYISHPPRDEFRPSDDANLEQWLVEHNLLIEERADDIIIAGTTAIHTRNTHSGQSYPYDIYTFAHAGQIYQVTILHTGDKQDWDIYNQFLQSFLFAQ